MAGVAGVPVPPLSLEITTYVDTNSYLPIIWDSPTSWWPDPTFYDLQIATNSGLCELLSQIRSILQQDVHWKSTNTSDIKLYWNNTVSLC